MEVFIVHLAQPARVELQRSLCWACACVRVLGPCSIYSCVPAIEHQVFVIGLRLWNVGEWLALAILLNVLLRASYCAAAPCVKLHAAPSRMLWVNVLDVVSALVEVLKRV